MSCKVAERKWLTKDVKDRALGCMYGLLVGDALGAPFEFMLEGSYSVPEEGDYVEGGMHYSSPGEWTDDGSMALALADSLSSVGWDRKDQLDRYVDWLDNGAYTSRGSCFDIGRTTVKALDRYKDSGDPDHAGKPITRFSAGNGSIMRLAPVPIYCALSYEDTKHAVEMAESLGRASSTTTHGHHLCVRAAGELSGWLCQLIRDKDDTELDIGRDPRKEEQYGVSGFVSDTLDAALWCYQEPDHTSDTFFGCVVSKAVSLGGDTDTVGAVAGQLAGAAVGLKGIPKGWISKLDGYDMAERIITRLVEAH